MSLERKDLKFYVDADVHAALKALAEHDETTLADYVEQLIAPAVRRKIHDAMLLADRFRRAGIVRREPESEADQATTD